MTLTVLIFPITLLAALLASAICFKRLGYDDFRTQGSLVVLICLLLSFAIAFAQVCYEPYFVENDVKEFIEWRFRWAWAMIYAGILQFIVIPVGLIIFVVKRKYPR